MNEISRQKGKVALKLARFHQEIDPGMRQIFRLLASEKTEDHPREPVKLLAVNQDTVPTGILPLHFPPQPEEGYPFSTVYVEITPEEFVKIQSQELTLPQDWKVGPRLTPSKNGRKKTS